MTKPTLSTIELSNINKYWQAANYLSVGQIYLYKNPLLRRTLTSDDIKPRLLGHWGTTPGLNFIYAHLNRVIKKNDLDMIYITGPGHGGPALVANTYLEGSYTELYPQITQDEEGMKKLFKQFSFPGGIPSHVAPDIPGSIHEGGELGYALSHAFGAAFDNPDLIVACIIGDGEAETGPLAASWHSNKFLNPLRDGMVLPILHLNGYKISNPTVLARIPEETLKKLLEGYGYSPYFVTGREPAKIHELMATTLDQVLADMQQLKKQVKNHTISPPYIYPMIVLRTPKGWTGPQKVHGVPIEGSFRSHQVPLKNVKNDPEELQLLEKWLKSYHPHDLFTKKGDLIPSLKSLIPAGNRRMGSNLHANGGLLLKDLMLPNIDEYAVKVSSPGCVENEATKVLGKFLQEVMKQNKKNANFRIFSPDETSSNRLSALFNETGTTWVSSILPEDVNLSDDGRVMDILSEHICQGWLEGYLLTGRHGIFSCYEAFIHVIDSMFNQHAKWLKVTQKEIRWRRPIASLNYLLTSHVWRQDHNGFSHQDPGFIDHAVNKKADVIRIYLPPDANTLLSVAEHCLNTRNYINIIVSGKQLQPQWLDIAAARQHCAAGIGIWEWASNTLGDEPDLIMAAAGDVPTIEILAAVKLLKEYAPEVKVRMINVVDLMMLQPKEEHPHGLSNAEFDLLFTKNKPVIFAYHGYPWLIHRLTYRRNNHQNIHVRGYKEEGTTTTPFDMLVRNNIDRFHLILDAATHTPELQNRGGILRQIARSKWAEHKKYIEQFGEDMPEIKNWSWSAQDE